MRYMIEVPLPPSPGAQEHVSIDLVNSAFQLPGGRSYDALGTPEATADWLIERGLVDQDAVLQAYCQSRLHGLRDVLRVAFGARVAGDPIEPQVLDRINSAMSAAPTVALLRQTSDGSIFRSTEHPVTQLVEHAMAVIAEDAADLLAGEDAALLAQCEAEPCTRFLLKTHGRRQWCSTRCGDRVRAARAYARKRSAIRG